jgi:hypothetical protein
MFSGSIEEGKSIQQSSVIFGSRAGSVSFPGLEVGKGNVTVPPSNSLCAGARTQLLASTPSAITLNVSGSTLADAVATSISATANAGTSAQEVQISLSYEGGVASIVAPTGTAPTSYTPKTTADCHLSIGGVGVCVTQMSCNINGTYERIACIGESTASKGFAGATTCTGSVVFFAPGGFGTFADGDDIDMDFAGFGISAKNVLINKKVDIPGPTGSSISIDFTARSPDGTLDPCFAAYTYTP